MEVGEHGRIQVEGRGFAQVVVPGPDKLAGAFRHGVLVLPFIVRLGGPAGSIQVIGADLIGGFHRPAFPLFLRYREAVKAARGDAGGRFRAVERLVRVGVAEFRVQMRLVIEAIDIQRTGIGLRRGPGVVVAGGGGTGRILAVADVREHLGNPPAAGIALLSTFVAHAPCNYAGVVAVPVNHGHQVLLRPVGKEGGVPVVLLGPGPGVRELVQHQEAHAVAQVQELRCGRVVTAADGIAAHGF